jgi:methyl-accepting chemotaxis protein
MTSLKHVLMLLVFAGVGAAGLLTGVSLWEVRQSEAAVQRAFVAKDVTADILPPPMYLIELRLVLSQTMEGTMTVEQARSESSRLKADYDKRVEYWKAHPPYGLEAYLFDTQHAAALELFVSADKTLAAIAASGAVSAQPALQQAHAAYLKHRAGVDRTVAASLEFADVAAKNFDRTGRLLMIVVTSVLAVAVVLLFGLGVWARNCVGSMTGGEPHEAAAVANAVAQGNLSIGVSVARGDTASVMSALARMCANLSTLVATVRHSSDSIATGAAQISAGNADLLQRTEVQASGLQEAASSMDEISSTVKHNADNARQAEQLAKSASGVAARGGVVVDQVVTTMGAISASSKKVSDILAVIDDIAFQTNILALNAAVEAARAGEQGRGFAVVAAEVQALARRSADAAREIKVLIASSLEQVEQGSKLVNVAGVTMNDIVTQANKVAQLVSHITDATLQQNEGIEKVSSAISQLDAATRENGALVQESAAAAETLSELAVKLVESVTVFKLAEGGPQRPRALATELPLSTHSLARVA